MAETKPKPESSMRTPRAKKTLGLSVPPALRMPHEDLISTPSRSSPASQTSQTPVAPTRDFHKVPNSIPREAVPGGLFKGKSKQLWDCLYQMTRGAIVPVRSVRISRPKLMKKAGIGARVTFETNINHLISVGLISVRQIVGEHEGNEYEVFTLEEISMPSHTSQGSQTRYAQKVDGLVRLENSQTRYTSIVEDKDTSVNPKTSFKTKEEKTDDEAARRFFEMFRQVERELTGKAEGVTLNAEKYRELAELLIAELRIAAARTTISSVPAFLTEHLRRRLWKTDGKSQSDKLPVTSDELQVTSDRLGIDASKCPDCGGTGMFYPEGYEKGVRKCSHDKLTNPA